MSDALQALLRPSRYPRSARYHPRWLVELDMGPGPLWQLEDLLHDMALGPGQTVLDLRYGKGATQIFSSTSSTSTGLHWTCG
jgi:hypothetical protein